ncbi:nucleotidyltransferase family protein [Paenibacillus amylolyticus]|nr:nucleotidyltransferase family protein [Paenibacillus amylolyticus]
MLEQPNNSLGLHYLIALQRLGSAIQPFTAARTGAAYHEATPGPGAIASATAVRRLLMADGPTPPRHTCRRQPLPFCIANGRKGALPYTGSALRSRCCT